jgi:hypothetical protein
MGAVNIDNTGAGSSVIVSSNGTSLLLNGQALISGTVGAANGGTGVQTLTANNVILGNGTSAVQFVAPGTSGNVLTSNGTTWVSQAASGGGGGITTGKAIAMAIVFG